MAAVAGRWLLPLLLGGPRGARGYDCVFIEDMHFKSAGPYPHAPTLHKEHCCDLCHETEGCAAGIFAKGDDAKGEPDTCWFKDAATAVKANEEKRPGNVACIIGDYATADERKEGTEADDGVGEWGNTFIKCAVALGLVYVVGGAAYGRRTRSDGKSALLWQWHPHYRRWEELSALCQDGIAFSRGRRRAGYAGVAAEAAIEGRQEQRSPKREKHRKAGGKSKGDDRGVDPQANDPEPPAANAGAAGPGGTAAGDGGRWVHVPS